MSKFTTYSWTASFDHVEEVELETVFENSDWLFVIDDFANSIFEKTLQKNVFKCPSSLKNLDNAKLLTGHGRPVICAIGGGQCMDYGKIISSRDNLPFVAAPTGLGANSFCTNIAHAIQRDGSGVSISTPTTWKILLDKKILLQSSQYNYSGIFEVLSVANAINDIKLAKNYGYNYKVSRPVEALSQSTVSEGVFLAEQLFDAPLDNRIIQLLLNTGAISGTISGRRLTSSSEHIIARVLEDKTDIPHALAVGVGLLFTTRLHRSKLFDTISRIWQHPVFRSYLETLEPKVMDEVLSNIKPRKGRFTIVDVFAENLTDTKFRSDLVFDVFSSVLNNNPILCQDSTRLF